jgi:hypothetical protein
MTTQDVVKKIMAASAAALDPACGPIEFSLFVLRLLEEGELNALEGLAGEDEETSARAFYALYAAAVAAASSRHLQQEVA